MNKRFIILVTIHKPYELPELPPEYRPIQVGNAPTIHSGFLRDNSGEHIAEKNSTFCELTALYWAWKNLDAEVIGLCHYRRYPGNPVSPISRAGKAKKDQILTGAQMEALLQGNDIILPRKRHYWIETRESQYAHAHHREDLQATEDILREKHPEYLPAWRRMLDSRSGHICNMFIMRRELMDEYCEWLFGILFEAEERLDLSEYNENDRRVFGFLGERLLDVWVETKGLRYAEVPMVNLEKQHWVHKGWDFLKRKIKG